MKERKSSLDEMIEQRSEELRVCCSELEEVRSVEVDAAWREWGRASHPDACRHLELTSTDQEDSLSEGDLDDPINNEVE